MMNPPFLVRDLLETIDGIADFALAESWDNAGLQAGNPSQPVRGIMVALDPTEEALGEAMASGCDVLVTHHPLLFKPLKCLRTDEPTGRLLAAAIQNGISIIGCHTNLDVVAEGVSDVLAQRLGLDTPRPLAPQGNAPPGIGFGRIGVMRPAQPASVFLKNLLTAIGVEAVRIVGPLPAIIETVALCGGSGSDLAPMAADLGAQVYVSGEIKHSTARWAEARQFCIIDAGHYATEQLVAPHFAAVLAKALKAKGLDLPVRASAGQTNPFRHVFLLNGDVQGLHPPPSG